MTPEQARETLRKWGVKRNGRGFIWPNAHDLPDWNWEYNLVEAEIQQAIEVLRK